MICNGQLISVHTIGQVRTAIIKVEVDDSCDCNGSIIRIEFVSPDAITREQQKKIYAMLRDISDYTGDSVDAEKWRMKERYLVSLGHGSNPDDLSFATMLKVDASDFIDHMIEFIIRNSIPSSVPLYLVCEDTDRYVYVCALNKVCCICGKPCQQHHSEPLGMGIDRDTVPQIGWPMYPLCWEHHREAHSNGEGWLRNDLHLLPVKIDHKIAEVYRMPLATRRDVNSGKADML